MHACGVCTGSLTWAHTRVAPRWRPSKKMARQFRVSLWKGRGAAAVQGAGSRGRGRASRCPHILAHEKSPKPPHIVRLNALACCGCNEHRERLVDQHPWVVTARREKGKREKITKKYVRHWHTASSLFISRAVLGSTLHFTAENMARAVAGENTLVSAA